MLNLILLFLIRLHLIDLVLAFGSDVSGVVSSVVNKLLSDSKIHDVCTNGVHEILRVRSEDLLQNLIQ